MSRWTGTAPEQRGGDAAGAVRRTPDGQRILLARVVVAPDRSRSAYWNGSSTTTDNAWVYAGPDCEGEPLFSATFVRASDSEEAADLAAALGGTADPVPLGASGATGRLADVLYYCQVAPRPAVVELDPPRSAVLPSGW